MRYTLVLVVLCLVACGEADVADEAQDAQPASLRWIADVVLEIPDKIGGCAVGDLDPAVPGNEIAAVCKSGDVHLLRRHGVGWRDEVIARFPGEMIQCAIGDVDPGRDGPELVVVGMAEGDEDAGGKGAAHVVFRDGGAWSSAPVTQDEALIHGVAIGDVDAGAAADVRHEGPEVVTVGFSMKARAFAPESDGSWREVSPAFSLPSPGKTAVAYRGGVAVACSGGTVTLVGRTQRGVSDLSRSRDLVRAPAGYARIAADGDDLLVARDDGRLELVAPAQDGGFDGKVIHREQDKLRGAVLADLDPTAPGREAATAGYGKRVTVLYPPPDDAPDGAWKPVVVFEDDAKLHHLAVGELLAEGAGLELVTCGYSGRVVVAHLARE